MVVVSTSEEGLLSRFLWIFYFTARFARAAESAEMNILSIAVERTAMESHSAADAAATGSCHKDF
jgi:hypothetical protein